MTMIFDKYPLLLNSMMF